MQPKLFFVLGLPKSGTTWLQHLLNAHPNISCRGEGMFHQFAENLKPVIASYRDNLAGRAYWLDGGFPTMTNKEAGELLRYFIEMRMRNNPTEKPNLKWIGEKDPVHASRSQMMMSLFKSETFIHIIRDPRDRAVSFRFHLHNRKQTIADQERFMLGCAREWTNIVADVRASAKKNGVRYHELRYEDLLARPIETAAAVFNFLGVDTAPAAQCIEAASFEKLSGGRKPGQEDLASFYRKGVQGDWRNHMDAEQERAFIAATGGLMADLGYA